MAKNGRGAFRLRDASRSDAAISPTVSFMQKAYWGSMLHLESSEPGHTSVNYEYSLMVQTAISILSDR